MPDSLKNISSAQMNGHEDAAQLTLDILPPPQYDIEKFIESPLNEEALSALKAWPHWPFPILSLYGPKKSGKTYLAHLWQKRSGAVFIDIEKGRDLLSSDTRETDSSNFILEDLTISSDTEKFLFDFYNWILEKKKFLLITSLRPLSQETYTLNDLKSRFKSLRAIEIKSPDETLLLKLMQFYFQEARLYVRDDLLKFALLRLERSFEAILNFCETLNKTALSTHSKITLPLIKTILEKEH
ncbi:MAG: hypothetical protein JSS34_05215 [Proteobacteria bacterium]|nr:hypothetical protein [Pseudomonadota bacterium]